MILDSRGIEYSLCSFLWVTFVTIFVSLVINIIFFISTFKEGKFAKFISKNFVSFLSFTILIALFVTSYNSIKNIDLGKSEDLLGIEWAIFGVSAAIFLFKLEKRREQTISILNADLDSKFGDERYRQALEIRDFNNDMFETTLMVIYLMLNALCLTLFTGSVFLQKTESLKNVVSYFYALSLVLTTNTFIQVFLNIIIGYFKSRKMVLNENKFSEKYIDKVVIESVFESVIYKNFKEELIKRTDLSSNEKRKILDAYIEKCISTRTSSTIKDTSKQTEN